MTFNYGENPQFWHAMGWVWFFTGGFLVIIIFSALVIIFKFFKAVGEKLTNL
jgi:hypothetical protein